MGLTGASMGTFAFQSRIPAAAAGAQGAHPSRLTRHASDNEKKRSRSRRISQNAGSMISSGLAKGERERRAIFQYLCRYRPYAWLFREKTNSGVAATNKYWF